MDIQSEASFHWFDNWVKICKDYGFSVGGFNQELYWGGGRGGVKDGL